MEPPSSNPTGHNLEQPALVVPASSCEVGADTSRGALQPQTFGGFTSEFQKDGAYWDLCVILQIPGFVKEQRESENSF